MSTKELFVSTWNHWWGRRTAQLQLQFVPHSTIDVCHRRHTPYVQYIYSSKYSLIMTTIMQRIPSTVVSTIVEPESNVADDSKNANQTIFFRFVHGKVHIGIAYVLLYKSQIAHFSLGSFAPFVSDTLYHDRR